MRRFPHWLLACGIGLTAPIGVAGGTDPAQVADSSYDYMVLATTRTSTMQKEMNEAAEQGYRYQGVMGGDTAFGGSEVVVVMMRSPQAPARFAYKLLATNKTSTMQKEMQAAADDGYEYLGQTVFSSLFGGDEVVVIMERDKDQPIQRYEYQLQATSKTSTLQKELSDIGQRGFSFVGMTVGETAFGGKELVVITRRPVQ